MVPDFLVIDIDSHGTILHLEAFDLTLTYPDWYDALCTRIRRHGPLESGSVFLWKRTLQPTTVIGAVSTHHWVAKARTTDVDRALRSIAELANAVDARNISIAALGTRNGLRIGDVISRIERHLGRADRTIGVMLNDEDDADEARGSVVDPTLILPSNIVTFIWDDMLCRARRIRRRRLPARSPWIITIADSSGKNTEFFSDDVKVLRPIRNDERGLYYEARVEEFPYRASFELGDRLVHSNSKAVMGPTIRLPWNDRSVTAFLKREAEEMAVRKSTGTALRSPQPINVENGEYIGEIVWVNEGFLLQRVAGVVQLHELKDLTFCAHCSLRLRAVASISYRNGTATVRAQRTQEFDAIHPDFTSIEVSREGGIDLRSNEFASLRPSGFAAYKNELALALMISRPRRRLFARIIAQLRRDRQLVLRSGASNGDDVDVRVLADVIALRYSKWLSAKRLPLAS